MNLNALKYEFFRVKDINVIGKTVEINDTLYHIMGMVLNEDKSLQLLILELNDKYIEKNDELNEARATNRVNQYEKLIHSFCFNLEKVTIGNFNFTVSGISGMNFRFQEHYAAALFTRFLLHGWTNDIDTFDTDYMNLTAITFNEKFYKIPNVNSSMPIHFSISQSFKQNLVEMPLDLNIGSDYPDKLYFYDKKDNKQHWIYINEVYLCDMWLDMEKTFDDIKAKGNFNDDEVENRKAEFETNFSKVCPKGMFYPVVKYECEEDIFLEFCGIKWLDSKPIYSNSVIGFLMEPNALAGKHGLKLKEALIQQPVTPDTKKIEVELFCYNETLKGYEIVI